MLVNLRGDKRRAMELAISKANEEYEAAENKASEEITAALPALTAAYERYRVANDLLVEQFHSEIPEMFKSLSTYRPDPVQVRNNPSYYATLRQDVVALRYKNSQELYKFREFLLVKQAAKAKPVKTDAVAVKLIEEFDASRQLTAGSDDLSDLTPVIHPDGTIEPEIA